ncbi:MAG: hypothetical protein FD123_2013 [Bacteroidetes bacterium]|nr:MAG: hypothetical protein FD123_2013 [Bacteroidota bacterium]
MAVQFSCASCGGNETATDQEGKTVCKYCGGIVHPGIPWSPFTRTVRQAKGYDSWSFVYLGLVVFTAASLYANAIDQPGWFRSDFAIAIWSVIIPVLALCWMFMLHPKKRLPVVLLVAVLANTLPFVIGAILEKPGLISKDDLWGIAAMFAGTTLAGIAIGGILNNLRSNSSSMRKWFFGK